MKKFLAVMLVLALLCPFAMVSAGASGTEEDLKAQAQALVHETFELLSSGTFTIVGTGLLADGVQGQNVTFTANGDSFAIETENDWAGMTQSPVLGFVLRVLLGKTMQIVFLPDKKYIVFPGRRVYVDLGALFEEEYLVALPALLSSDQEPDVSGAREVVLNGKPHLCVSLEDNETLLYYHEGQLKRSDTLSNGEFISGMAFDALTDTADQSLFRTKWMIPIPMMLFVRILSYLE